jgi:signal transduction histidine kinase
MLGLGLVVAIIALLLAGTLKGLSSYRATTKTMESKLSELCIADKFKLLVAELKPMVDSAGNPEKKNESGGDPKPSVDPENAAREQRENEETIFQTKLDEAEKALQEYKEILQDTVKLKRDPDKGYREMTQVVALKDYFRKLKVAWHLALNRPVVGGSSLRSVALSDRTVRRWVNQIVRTSGDLQNAINETLVLKIKKAGNDCKVSLAIVLATSVLGVLLMAGLLRFFYGWVFHPIRALEQGAGRVARGDFDHRINVRSGDEMEDLAAAFNDMTGRLSEMYRDLARQVNERSRQLVRSERLAGVGFLAAGVAHEINNPLASIAFCSEALDRRLGEVLADSALRGRLAKEDNELIAKYLKMIQQEAFRCKEITQRLLEFSRGGERRRDETNLVELVQGVLDVVQHLQNCKGKELVFRPPAQLVAWVNGQEIKSVVLNLVVNALDSMDEGGRLTITLRQHGQMAEMVFTDTGCGMTAEILENIFEPFYTRSRTGKGTGLGLSISHRIISQHGGEIEAVSPGPNEGSTFTVRLPLKPAEPASMGSDKAVEEYPVFPAQTMGSKAA